MILCIKGSNEAYNLRSKLAAIPNRPSLFKNPKRPTTTTTNNNKIETAFIV